MTREIIFRAKRSDTGEWVYGDLTHTIRITVDMDVPCIRIAGYDVDEETIGQYTGLNDCDGKEIYEGDMLSGGKGLYEVVYYEFGFRMEPLDYKATPMFMRGFLQVASNRFDNPELLQEERQ